MSTGHAGGAGLAARRLNSALNKAGIESHFFALRSSDYVMGVNEHDIDRNIFERLLSGTLVRLQKKFSSKVLFSIWSLSTISNNEIIGLAGNKRTIFHFHNWYNLIAEDQLFELAMNGKTVVATLHDQRLLTGGCHYAIDCKLFETGCAKCPHINSIFDKIPNLSLSRKISAINDAQDFQPKFISPSLWMLEGAQKSLALGRHQHVHISNTLGDGQDISQIYPKVAPTTSFTIGVASMDVHSYIKGGDVIKLLEQRISKENGRYKLVMLSNYINQGRRADDFWNDIDCLLVPSRADNSPNVIHEAKSRVIPVVATDIGGIRELLHPEYDIALDSELLTGEHILNCLDKVRLRNLEKSIARKSFEAFEAYTGQSINSHIKFYASIIASELNPEKDS